MESLFAINWKIKSRAYIVDNGNSDIEMVGLEIPPIVPTSTLKAFKITYRLYLMNLADPAVQSLPYSINVYSRCPSLMPSLQPLVINETTTSQAVYF